MAYLPAGNRYSVRYDELLALQHVRECRALPDVHADLHAFCAGAVSLV
ncbi:MULTISPECIES: hypothetical protein [unclassified Pseudomonas]|nr:MULTISPECIES: hypothetical protein [unclassified Pseudomonas]